MLTVKTRKDHQCAWCLGQIKSGSMALRIYTDCRTFVGRKYYCEKCGEKVLLEAHQDLTFKK